MDEEMLKQALLLSALQNQNEPDDAELFVSSVTDAITLLQMHMAPSGARYRRDLVEYITDPSHEVLGECDKYHNLIMDLLRCGDPALALRVCDYALNLAPYDRDILGDTIKACGDSCQFKKGDGYLERAMEIPLEKWSYRLFLYSVDFLKMKLSAYPTDDSLYQRALSLADEYIKYFPFDEHGYNQKAELLLLMNHREQAISELKRSIFEVQPDTSDSRSELITAQCCATLLQILNDSNNYDMIIEICERGLRSTTQEQPSASIGFFMYKKALALDAKAHAESFRVPATVTDALTFYQAAYDLNQDRQYSKTIEQRYAVLRPHAQSFRPLVKRELYVVEEETTTAQEE